MPTVTDNPVVKQSESKKSEKPDFGAGRYSALMQECYDDAQVVFGLNPTGAEKLARQIASEVGAIMASATIEVRLGKLSKDAKLTIAEACKVKGITQTDTLTCLRALKYAGEAGKNGFSFGFTKWTPVQAIKDYLAKL